MSLDINLPKLSSDEIQTIENGLKSKNPIHKQRAQQLLNICIDEEMKNPSQDNFIFKDPEKKTKFLNTVNDISRIAGNIVNPQSVNQPQYMQPVGQNMVNQNIPDQPKSQPNLLIIGGIAVVLVIVLILIFKK